MGRRRRGRQDAEGGGRLAALTGVQQLCDVGGGGEQQDDVVERHGADEVEEEPRLEVAFGDLPGLEDDLIREVVRDDPCNVTTTSS